MYPQCVQHILAFFFTFESIFEFSGRKNPTKIRDFSMSVLGYTIILAEVAPINMFCNS